MTYSYKFAQVLDSPIATHKVLETWHAIYSHSLTNDR